MVPRSPPGLPKRLGPSWHRACQRPTLVACHARPACSGPGPPLEPAARAHGTGVSTMVRPITPSPRLASPGAGALPARLAAANALSKDCGLARQHRAVAQHHHAPPEDAASYSQSMTLQTGS